MTQSIKTALQYFLMGIGLLLLVSQEDQPGWLAAFGLLVYLGTAEWRFGKHGNTKA